MQPNKMTTLLDRARRAALLLLLAALAACGPGTGGTGTGPIQPLGSFSGSAVASSMLPDPLCGAQCDKAALQLQEQKVELAAGCLRFASSGSWAPDASNQVVLEGSLQVLSASGATTSTPATLRLQFNDKDSAVQAVLLGNGVTALLGPVTLLREGEGSAATPAPDCRALTAS